MVKYQFILIQKNYASKSLEGCVKQMAKRKKFSVEYKMEGWYNIKRLHSAINYLIPNQCELMARDAA